MSRSHYYEKMKELAREVRANYGFVTPRVMKSDMRIIYRDQEIKIDLWPPKDKSEFFHNFKHLRGAYFHDEYGTTVLLARSLPQDPAIFTLAHELKHHLEDRDQQGFIFCDLSNQNDQMEIGAEIFAAELIFPEQDFVDVMLGMNVEYGKCCPSDIVKLKRETKTTLSYTGLAKRAVFLSFANVDALENVKWKKLEEEIYGEPVYKRVQRYRKRKKL